MSELTPTKPYLVRALHEWCIDNGLTPHLLVTVNAETRVPMGYVKDGEIVLNLSYTATKDLVVANDAVTFSARFSGVSQNLYVPMNAVRGIFARENGQGMFFQVEADQNLNHEGSAEQEQENNRRAGGPDEPKPPKKPSLKIVK